MASLVLILGLFNLHMSIHIYARRSNVRDVLEVDYGRLVVTIYALSLAGSAFRIGNMYGRGSTGARMEGVV